MKLILGGRQHGRKMLKVQKTDQELQRYHGTSLQMVPPNGKNCAEIEITRKRSSLFTLSKNTDGTRNYSIALFTGLNLMKLIDPCLGVSLH